MVVNTIFQVKTKYDMQFDINCLSSVSSNHFLFTNDSWIHDNSTWGRGVGFAISYTTNSIIIIGCYRVEEHSSLHTEINIMELRLKSERDWKIQDWICFHWSCWSMSNVEPKML